MGDFGGLGDISPSIAAATPPQRVDFTEAEKRGITVQQLQAENSARSSITSGQELGREIMPEGVLGRIDDKDKFEVGRSADIQDVIARRKEALSGIPNAEQVAQRENAVGGIQRGEETARRSLSRTQASQGVRGATAAAQQQDVISAGIGARGQFERDLFLSNEQSKRTALTELEASVGAAEGNEFKRQAANLEIEQFNLQQAAQERFGQISTGLGFSELVAGDIASQRAAQAAKAAGKV